MPSPASKSWLQSAVEAWHRRWWRPSPAALAAFDKMIPVVIVTGASAGIGRAIAERFAAEGANLLLIARDATRLEAVASELRRSTKSRVVTLAVDITAPDAIGRIEAALGAMHGFAEILVNNAGIGLAGRFVDHPTEALARLVALNVAAMTLLCRYVLPGQLIRGRGGIINIASLGGYLPGPQQAAYYATKAYALSLSEALAAETAGLGVRVTCVAPGPVTTDFHAKMGASNALVRWFVPEHSPERVARAAVSAFRRGQRVVLPGIGTKLLAPIVRVLPHRLLAPITAFLLKPRGKP